MSDKKPTLTSFDIRVHTKATETHPTRTILAKADHLAESKEHAIEWARFEVFLTTQGESAAFTREEVESAIYSIRPF